jgi:hypothetical protein
MARSPSASEDGRENVTDKSDWQMVRLQESCPLAYQPEPAQAESLIGSPLGFRPTMNSSDLSQSKHYYCCLHRSRYVHRFRGAQQRPATETQPYCPVPLSACRICLPRQADSDAGRGSVLQHDQAKVGDPRRRRSAGGSSASLLRGWMAWIRVIPDSRLPC